MSGRHQPEHGADSTEGLATEPRTEAGRALLRLFDNTTARPGMHAVMATNIIDVEREAKSQCQACSLPAVLQGYCAGHNRLFDYTDAEAAGGIAAND